MSTKDFNQKLESVLTEINRCEETAIATRSFEMPTQKQICQALGIGVCYFRSGTEPSQIAYAALMAAQERLDHLSGNADEKSGRDTNLERCCGCFQLKRPALSKPSAAYGKQVTKHFCRECLSKQLTKNSRDKAA